MAMQEKRGNAVNDDAHDHRGPGSNPDAPRGAATKVGRRAMLRGAAAAVPTILTLHSGAALARSSNLLHVADGAPVDAKGRNLCIDESSVKVESGPPKAYDLGEPAHANVTAIPTGRTYYRDTGRDGPTVSPQEMCQTGGEFYYKGNPSLDALDVPSASDSENSVGFGVRMSADWQKKNQGWTKVSVPRGGLVSATALASFAGRVNVREI